MHRLVIFLAAVAVAHGRGRIVGGEDADIENYKYQVSVEYQDRHWYGGALIKLNTVITEASFILPKEKHLKVRAGSSTAEKGGTAKIVSKVHVHPKFKPDPSNDYNVAVLILNEPFESIHGADVIELAQKSLSIPEGTIGTVTGWGGTEKGQFDHETLQFIQVPFVPWNTCKQHLKHRLTERLSCWGEKDLTKDVCNSDQGGPLVIEHETKRVLAAVVSFAIDCGVEGTMGYPRTYTAVTNPEIHDFFSQYLEE